MITAQTSVPVPVKAQGTLTMAVQPIDGDTLTIGTKIYTWEDTLTDEDGHIFTGADLAAAKVNLVAAINASGGTPGTTHALSTTAHPTVTAGAFIVNAMILTAILEGADGNSIATTETFDNVANVFDAATLGTTTAGVSAVSVFSAPSDMTVAVRNQDGSNYVELGGSGIQMGDGFRLLPGVTLSGIEVLQGEQIYAGANTAAVVVEAIG